jgi:DNA-binding PadR family transcriptional regulator
MRYPFLALLAQRPSHGYELRQALEHRFASLLPPMNAGQIYTTLGRLERDGLVTGHDVEDDSRNKRIYELTETGRAALAEWLSTPSPGPRLKDEFFMKLVLAGLSGIADAKGLIDRQRREYLQALRDLDELALRQGSNGDPAAELLIEGTALHLEADLKWLDLCEQRLLPKGEHDGSNGARG